MSKGMTNKQVIAYLRKWVEDVHGVFAWPTDACGYEQHIRFVKYRNARLRETTPENLKAANQQADYKSFILEYARKLENGEIPPYKP